MINITNEEVWRFLSPLSEDYPDFGSWFWRKVVPGRAKGTRAIVSHRHGEELVAVGIAKNERGEKKVCTLRVAPSWQGHGIGPRLLDRMLHWLDTPRPHLTVGAHKLPQFERMFDSYGWSKTSEHPDLYLPGRIELGFNEGT